MRYDEWQVSVPDEIKGDSLWKLEVYRLGLFVSDIAWQDALVLSKTLLARDLANQLYRAVCSISANIAEGYSRSTGKDRARFLEYSLGSAREARDWYYKSRHTLKEEVTNHRINLLTQIIKCLMCLHLINAKKESAKSKRNILSWHNHQTFYSIRKSHSRNSFSTFYSPM